MKLTYIYITDQEKKTLKKICIKNKISLSALTTILINTTYYCLEHYGIDKEQNKIIEENYLISRGLMAQATTIKPKCFKENELMNNLIKNKNKYATNVLLIYLNKRQLDYMTEEGKNHYFNMLNQKIQETFEKFWDYNNFVRSSRRNLRQNKEYFKRAIAKMEGN